MSVEVGSIFGKWTVLSLDTKNARRKKWNCRCECGNLGSIANSILYRGTSTSCRSCGDIARALINKNKRSKLIGTSIGDWKIIEDQGLRKRTIMFKCECICGYTKSSSYTSLRRMVHNKCTHQARIGKMDEWRIERCEKHDGAPIDKCFWCNIAKALHPDE